MDQDQPKRVRRYASTIGILILLAAVLGFYYFKYVPERQNEFNKAAFLELNQIEYALQYQNHAYHEALQNIIRQPTIDTRALSKFNYNAKDAPPFDHNDCINSSRFKFIESTGDWRLAYPVYKKDPKKPIYTLSKNADTLMSGFVSTYKDIFSGYLLIDNQDSLDDEYDKGQILFQSGDPYMSSFVEPDSLLKKNGRFGQNNLLDITIEGNDYKLFVYPFEMGSQNLILVGLISDSKYREANLKIPFSLFSVFIVIILLLVIHLPILRIYILGSGERIRESDIRLIIGSYFVAAFFGFFIFTKIFLNKEQAVLNKNNIDTISCKIISNFQTELGFINRQLASFDGTLEQLRKDSTLKCSKKKDNNYLKSMSASPDECSIRFLDALFEPQIYPYPDNVFWINKKGNWVARWGFKDVLTNSPLIDVADRSYFKDFLNNEPLSITGVEDSITIQPTLSKLEGEYVVTVARRSTVHPYTVRVPKPNEKNKKKKDTVLDVSPFVIGMSTEMHSVYNVVMPPGYNFSIIDESGKILYDSKPGRPLLSNIFKEMENPESIQQSALYRNKRYFENLRLRSKNMALLSTPIDGMPYQLLVYFNTARSDDFEEHLITLSSLLIGAVICLVIFSSLINRWSKDKNRMLESRSHHFEWLHPSGDFFKQKYYLHLIRSMLLLSGVYLLAWIFIEVLGSPSEFSFLFISLLFPFYIAVFYYELRERYYDVEERRTDTNWYYARPSIALRGSLLIIIILINCYTSYVEFSWGLALPVLITQLVWAVMILLSTIRFKHFMMIEKNLSDPENKKSDGENKKQEPDSNTVKTRIRSFLIQVTEPIRSVIFAIATYKYGKGKMKTTIPVSRESKVIRDESRKPNSTSKIPVNFIWAILTGVTLVSIVPAFSLFWLFYRQENALYLHTDQLIMSKEIDQRSQAINQNIKEFKYNAADPINRSEISKRKFSDGIYMTSGKAIADNEGVNYAQLPYPTNEYIQLHDRFFRDDSLVLDWTQPYDSAADKSWYFVNKKVDHSDDAELLYSKRKDVTNPGPFRLTSNPYDNCNVSSFIIHSFSGMGTAFSIFFIVGLCFSLTIAYFLTHSLARRVFLVELQQVVGYDKNQGRRASKLYEESGIQPAIRSMILGTPQQTHGSSPDSAPTEVNKDDSWKPSLRDIYHFEKKLPLYKLEAMMPSLINTLEPVYYNLWNKLSARYKFILFDFAQDGFANYKAGKDLQALIEKGLLFFDGQRLSVMTLSFQEYILQQKDDPELNVFLNKAKKEYTWNKFQTPLLILVMAAGIFIFATQEEVYKKITGLLASISTLLPLLTGLFGKPAGKSGDS